MDESFPYFSSSCVFLPTFDIPLLITTSISAFIFMWHSFIMCVCVQISPFKKTSIVLDTNHPNNLFLLYVQRPYFQVFKRRSLEVRTSTCLLEEGVIESISMIHNIISQRSSWVDSLNSLKVQASQDTCTRLPQSKILLSLFN